MRRRLVGVQPPREMRSQTLAQITSDRLRKDIITGEFKPGERLTLTALCARYEVSMSPLREALAGLAAEQFIVFEERLGFRVERLLARVGPDGGPARGRTHLTLRVTSGQAGTGAGRGRGRGRGRGSYAYHLAMAAIWSSAAAVRPALNGNTCCWPATTDRVTSTPAAWARSLSRMASWSSVSSPPAVM